MQKTTDSSWTTQEEVEFLRQQITLPKIDGMVPIYDHELFALIAKVNESGRYAFTLVPDRSAIVDCKLGVYICTNDTSEEEPDLRTAIYKTLLEFFQGYNLPA